MKKGDLITLCRRGSTDVRYATIIRARYTHRFMDRQDYEMEAHGMGEYAGSYGGAVDVLFTDTNTSSRIALGKHKIQVISENEA